MRDNPLADQLEEAIRGRLARLATVPVEASGLDRRLHALMERGSSRPAAIWLTRTWRPLATAAAILIVAAAAIVLMNLGTSPVMASPADMARLHAEVIKSDVAATAVTTLDQANRVLAQQWKDTPDLPVPPADQLRACCIHQFMDRKVACLLLRDGATPVTMVVGHARDFRCADGQVIERGGRKFTQHEVDGLRMVMTEQDGRYVCLMGELSAARLLEMAQELKF